jgi:hypothetical protein
MKIKIKFAGWTGKAELEIEAKSKKEAVEKAVKDGANLDGATLSRANLSRANLYGANLDGATLSRANLSRANLYGANLYGATLSRANLDGATLSRAKLWSKRPVLQLGQCGSRNGITLAYFFEDGREPEIRCGCFCGTLTEFRAKIHETHAGTFFEHEYNALADHIEAIYQIQKHEKESDNA